MTQQSLAMDNGGLIQSLMPEGWRVCQTPKTLEAMKGCHLLLLKDSLITYGCIQKTPSPITAGCVVTVYRPTNANQQQNSSYPVPKGIDLGPRERLLMCRWDCGRCRHTHTELLPHIWLEQGHMVFVTKD